MEVAEARGVSFEALGAVALRSIAGKVPLFSIEMTEAVDDGLDRSGLQDARTLLGLFTGAAGGTLVLLAGMRDRVQAITADICEIARDAGRAAASGGGDAVVETEFLRP